MSRYSLSLPAGLKRDAERHAAEQGISLNQFILWAVAEKVGGLDQALDDPAHPHVSYRLGAAGAPVPVVRGTGVRVQTLAVAARDWGWEPACIQREFDLSQDQVADALAFAAAHRGEIDSAIAAEASLEPAGA